MEGGSGGRCPQAAVSSPLSPAGADWDSAVRSSCSAIVRTTLLRKCLRATSLSSEDSVCSTRRSAERMSSVRFGIYRCFTPEWMPSDRCALPDAAGFFSGHAICPHCWMRPARAGESKVRYKALSSSHFAGQRHCRGPTNSSQMPWAFAGDTHTAFRWHGVSGRIGTWFFFSTDFSVPRLCTST